MNGREKRSTFLVSAMLDKDQISHTMPSQPEHDGKSLSSFFSFQFHCSSSLFTNNLSATLDEYQQVSVEIGN